MKEEIWTSSSLRDSLADVPQSLDWLAKRSLIANSRKCRLCQRAMTLVKYSKGLDLKRWSCRPCQQTLFVRHGSFCHRSNLSLSIIVQLIYWWTGDYLQCQTAHELSINKNTIVDWFNFCRDECMKFVADNDGMVFYLYLYIYIYIFI